MVDVALTVNGNSVAINSGLAAIDTGTTLLGGLDLRCFAAREEPERGRIVPKDEQVR